MTYPPQQPQFSQPSSGGGGGDQFDAKDHRGHLLLVYPKQYQPEVPTKNGPSSAADVDIIIIDKPGPDGRPLSFIGARLFGNLANSVRNDIGGQVLGRLDQISTQGGRTPWVLNQFTEQDAAMAGPVHQQYLQGQFKPAVNPMAAPAAPPAPAQYAPPSAPAPAAQWQPPQPPATTPGGQWTQAPASTSPAAPAPPAAAPAALDPGLAAFLQQRGINTAGMTDETARAIAATFQ